MFCRDPNQKKATLADFEIINLIGRGSIANVFLVKKNDSGLPLAMKSMRKEQVKQDNLEEGTKLE